MLGAMHQNAQMDSGVTGRPGAEHRIVPDSLASLTCGINGAVKYKEPYWDPGSR